MQYAVQFLFSSVTFLFDIFLMSSTADLTSKKTAKKTGLSKSIAKPPLWLPVAEKGSIESNIVTRHIREVISKSETLLKKVNIKVKSVICSLVSSLANVNAIGTIKLSFLPLPAKSTIFRSTSTQTSSEGDTSSATFDFGLKSAILSMGVGEIRSRVYRDGLCPLLLVEFSVEGCAASGTAYLPHFISDYSGQSVQLNLSCIGSENKLFDQATVILEINPSNSVETTLIKSDTPSRFMISFSGLCGADLKQIDDVKSDLQLSFRLSSSGDQKDVDLTSCILHKGNILSTSSELTFESTKMHSDVVEINLRRRSDASEVGSAFIPCAAILGIANETAEEEQFVAINIWKRSDGLDTGAPPVIIKNIQIICKFKKIDMDDQQVAPETNTIDGSAEKIEEKLVEEVQDATDKPIAKTVRTASVSQSGSLLFGVQGFLSRRGSFSSKLLSQSNTIAVEITILPEGTKRRTALSSFLPLQCTDFEASVEWNKGLSANLAWSLQQVTY